MKRILSLILAVFTVIGWNTAVFAADNEAKEAADKLHELGLFNGTGTNEDGSPIFELEREPTRYEAMVMLIRLLGKEKEALAGKWEMPFTDVVDWAKPYVSYAYASGLTQGISPTEFGGDAYVSASQYLTFVLRALGYKDGIDFVWDRSWELTDDLGITEGEYSEKNDEFVRGDIAIISADALDQPLKDKEIVLKDHIREEIRKTEEKLEQEKNNAPIVSEPEFDFDCAAFIGDFCCYGSRYITSEKSVKIGMKVAESTDRVVVTKVSSSDTSVATAVREKDGTVTVTRKKDGFVYISVHYKLYRKYTSTGPSDGPAMPEGERVIKTTRTDVGINFGPQQVKSGLSLDWRGKITANENTPIGMMKSAHPLFVATVLYDGKPIKDYTVTTKDSSAKLTVQADGSLLIEMNESRSVEFTVKYGKSSSTFRAVN